MKAALNSPGMLNRMHGELAARGWKLLQPFRFGEDDKAHIAFLLAIANFPRNAKVLDIGCGVGECARLMKAARPDLEFVLLNFAEAQLADCPEGFEKHLGDAHNLPFDEGAFDAVMFNAALGNMDCMVALAEASRVLKSGGVLFLNEICRVAGDNADMERLLHFRAYEFGPLCEFAEAMGLTLDREEYPFIVEEYLRGKMDTADYVSAFAGTFPMLLRLVKGEATPIAAQHGAIFHRHERIALQVSGGKDSLTLLNAMRPWWDRLCVFWLNPGKPLDETVEMMEKIKRDVPNFVEVAGRQKEVIAEDGWPFDAVPHLYTSDGNFVFGATPFKVQARLSCCYRALMLPMHEKMVELGVTCVIRGKRAEEKDKTLSRTGTIAEGIEFVYPLWDWSAQDVMAYLEAHGIPLPESYQYANHSLDCMDCTAWSEEGLHRYLKARHPEEFREHVRKVKLVRAAVLESLSSTAWSENEDL
jgi:phosphoadenosine phosphosulfate reductase